VTEHFKKYALKKGDHMGAKKNIKTRKLEKDCDGTIMVVETSKIKTKKVQRINGGGLLKKKPYWDIEIHGIYWSTNKKREKRKNGK